MNHSDGEEESPGQHGGSKVGVWRMPRTMREESGWESGWLRMKMRDWRWKRKIVSEW